MDLKGSKIAVTGATGFLGRYIVDCLLERGAHVIGVVRNPDRVPELRDKGVELRKADLADADFLAAGFEGADAVVANAALFAPLNFSWNAHNRANIQGVQNTLDAMNTAGVKRLIHISSMAVYAGGSEPVITESRRQFNEQSKRRPWTVYSISKALSEQLAWRIAEQHNIDMTAMRPGAVYGAFDTNITRFFKNLWGGPVGLRPSGPGLRLVYAADVANAVALALEKSETSIGKSYNLISDERIELSKLHDTWKQAGGPVAKLTLPLPLPSNPGTPASIELASTDLGWSNTPFLQGFEESFALEKSARESRQNKT